MHIQKQNKTEEIKSNEKNKIIYYTLIFYLKLHEIATNSQVF